MDNRNFIAKRAAAYFRPGDVVNLGIGLPTWYPPTCLRGACDSPV